MTRETRDKAAPRLRADPPHRARRLVTAVFGAVTALGVASLAALSFKTVRYVDPWHRKVAEAGYVEKSARVNDITLHYVEGPDSGPPLVLLHAQFLDWFSYSRVLPALAKSFHVYVIDYPGHGHTVTPADYPMTANRIGEDIADFITHHIGCPVFLSGNSSGGLLATWLAAYRPALVRAAVLEDPPLYSSEFPEIKRTIANRAFITSYKATQDHPSDFLLYWIRSNARFFERRVGPGTPFLLREAVRLYRAARPGQPVELGLIRNETVRMLVRGLDAYDPRFGAAFYDGSWNRGFDHGSALSTIRCRTLLLQANYTLLADGTLDGAMTREQASRAVSLLKHGRYVKMDAGHVVNLDKPDAFLALLRHFFLEDTPTGEIADKSA